MMSNQNMSIGHEVQGMYFGREFVGVIKNKQCINQYKMLYFVDLESPIETSFGETHSICFEADVRDELTPLSERHNINLRKGA